RQRTIHLCHLTILTFRPNSCAACRRWVLLSQPPSSFVLSPSFSPERILSALPKPAPEKPPPSPCRFRRCSDIMENFAASCSNQPGSWPRKLRRPRSEERRVGKGG